MRKVEKSQKIERKSTPTPYTAAREAPRPPQGAQNALQERPGEPKGGPRALQGGPKSEQKREEELLKTSVFSNLVPGVFFDGFY